MNGKQYNNVIDWTLKHEAKAQSEDSLEATRAICKNLGVALPGGTMKEVADTLATDDYMYWRSCTMQEAQEAADNGNAAVGVSEERIVLLAATDEEQPVAETASVMTLDENTSAYAMDGMRYYVYGYGTTSTTGGGTTNRNKDYRGCTILTQDDLTLLNYNKPFYQEAANLYNIPWKMLAAIHFREKRLRRVGSSNGGGPYEIVGRNYPIGDYTDAQFLQATKDAAAFVKNKAGTRDLSETDNVKYTFFAYNGASPAYKNQALALGFSQEQANIGEGSPYVMNRADAKRDPTVEPTKSNGTWGQFKKDYGIIEYPANEDHGAYIVYCAI